VYFFYYMALGAFLPFINLYYRGLGLTGVQIGVLAALPALAASPVALAWGVLADVLHVHRGLFRAALLLTPLAGATALFGAEDQGGQVTQVLTQEQAEKLRAEGRAREVAPGRWARAAAELERLA